MAKMCDGGEQDKYHKEEKRLHDKPPRPHSYNPQDIMLTISYRVKSGKSFAKWGNYGEKLLNWVITVKNMKLWGKNWNLLMLYLRQTF
jgi:hypothetical protein